MRSWVAKWYESIHHKLKLLSVSICLEEINQGVSLLKWVIFVLTKVSIAIAYLSAWVEWSGKLKRRKCPSKSDKNNLSLLPFYFTLILNKICFATWFYFKNCINPSIIWIDSVFKLVYKCTASRDCLLRSNTGQRTMVSDYFNFVRKILCTYHDVFNSEKYTYRQMSEA